MVTKQRVKKVPYTDPDVAFRNLDDAAQYKYLLLDSPMAEQLFAAEFLDLELDPFQVFSLRLLRGRFASEEELWSFIYDNEMEWMFENGWIRHGNKEGVSPSYFKSYADGGGPNVLVLWPGGFGKTTTVTSKVMPAMEACDNPNARIQYIGKTDKESDKFSVAQRHVLMQPKLVKVFGQFQPDDKGVPWANYAYSVRQRQHADISENAEFYGSNSDAALGRRSDRVVIDDIETFVTARTPEQRAKLLEWVQTGPMTSARPMWGTDKQGRVLIPKHLKWSKTARYWGTGVVGTIFHPEGLYAMLMRNPNFTCVKFDCFRDRKCTISLSEKIMSAEALHAKRVTTLQTVFNKRYRNIAYDESEMAFREAWVRGQDEVVNGQTVSHPGCLDKERSFEEYGKDWDLYLGFDPASGSTSRWSAYAAYVILGIDKTDDERRIYLVDYLKLQDQFDRMLDWLLKGDPKYGIPGFYAKYAYKQGVVEKNAFGKWMLTNDRVSSYVKSGVIVPSYTGTNKSDPESGVFAMGNIVQNGRFRIPYKEPSDQAKAELFIADLLLYPKGTNDLVMAMWLAQIPMKLAMNPLRSWFTPGGGGKMVRNPAWSR